MVAEEFFVFRHSLQLTDTSAILALHTKVHATSRHNLKVGYAKKVVRVAVFRKVDLCVLGRTRSNEFIETGCCCCQNVAKQIARKVARHLRAICETYLPGDDNRSGTMPAA